MKTILILLAAFLLAAMHEVHASPLFDGKSFEGWVGNTNVFQIRKGAIVGGSLKSSLSQNEFLCTTRTFTNFILRLKFKLIGEGANAGVQFRTSRIPNSNEVSGYQADMGDPEWWGCLYDESRRNKVLAKSDIAKVNDVLKRGDWNQYEIRCEGRRIRIVLNGVQTVDYTESDPSIDISGIIAVQIHGGPPSEAWYKDIDIQEL